jgi:predicted DNA-binding transcriptional regulator YafY
MDISHRALADSLTDRGVFFAMMEAIQPSNGKLDEFIGIYNSPAWSKDSIQLPIELSEAIKSGKRLRITYVDGKGQHSQRWVTPYNVIGLSDYLYLHAYCHLREAERSFRLDRIVKIGIEV